MSERTPNLDTFREEIKRLEKGNELLEQVWAHFGPYGFPKGFPSKLHSDIHYFFEFDDSE